MRNTAIALIGYGAFLILVGLAGYLSNPEKAKTALLSGGTFGLLNIGLGLLASRNWRRAPAVALAVAGFLTAVFTWRTIATWSAYAGGKPEKLVAGVLITSMLIATIGIAAYLVRILRRG
jgi:Na+/proline symporter